MPNFSGSAAVRHSMFFSMANQVAQIDRLICARNTSFDSEWASEDFFHSVVTAGMLTACKACITASALYLGQKLYQKPLVGPPILAQSAEGAGACGDTGTFLPSQTCGLIQWKSPIGGPQGRGRTYMPFPATTSNSGLGVPATAYLDAVTDFATFIITGIVIPNVGSGVGSLTIVPVTKYVAPGPPALPVQMDEFFIALGWATQRKRGFFGKPNSNPF